MACPRDRKKVGGKGKEKVDLRVQERPIGCRGVQPFGVSGPHWKKKSCLGPHIKYIATGNHKKTLIMFEVNS